MGNRKFKCIVLGDEKIEMKYKEYKDNYEYICKMNDLRECMVQDFVIAPI